LHWLIRIDCAQTGAQFLNLRLNRLCDHEIGLALQDLVEDRDILACLRLWRTNRSFVRLGLMITVTSGLSMSGTD
jgi:hypothetical protein